MIYLSKHIVEIEIKKSKMINIVTGNKNSFTKAKLYAGYPKEEIMKNIKLCYTDIVTHILDDLIRTNKKDTQLMEGIWMDVKSFKLFQALDAYDVLIQFSKYNNLSLLKKYEKKLPIIFDFFQSNIWKQYQDQLLLFCILIVCFGTYCSTFFPEFLSQYNLLTSFPFEKENVVSSSPNINNLFDIFFTTKYIQYEVVTSGKTFALQLETTDNKIFERNLIEATPDFTIGDLQGYFDIIVSFFQHFVDHFDKYIDIRNFMTKDLRRSTIKEIIEGFALSFYVLLNKRNQQLLRLNESNDPIQNIFSEIYQDETRLVKLYVMVLVQLNKEHPFYIKDIKEYFQFFTVVYPGQFHKNIFFPKLGQ
jgi:arsenate reductase-like glutaredoxin family protein